MNQDKIVDRLLSESEELTIQVINKINQAKSLVFPDPKYADLFDVIKEYVYKYNVYPTIDFMESYFTMDNSDSDAKVAFAEVTQEDYDTKEPLDSLIDYQIKYSLKHGISNMVDDFKSHLKVTSIGEVLDRVGELNKEISLMISIADSSNKDIISLKSKEAYIEEKERLEAEEDDYYMSEFLIQPFDDGIGGVKKDDHFLGILASAKQFKSTLLRYMVYKQLLQGKNVLFISLEMSIRSIKEHFYVIHSQNRERWGYTSPSLTTNKIRRKNLTEEEKEFYLQVVRDFNSNKQLGDLTLLTPRKKYSFQDMVGDAIEQVHTMKVDDNTLDLLVVDYLSLVAPKQQGRVDVSDINDMIKQTRLFGLEIGVPIWTPIQTNRMGFKKSSSEKEDEVGYDLTDIGMYSEFEKSLTDIVYIAQNPEMKSLNSVKIGSVLHRECPGFTPFYAQVNPQTGWFHLNEGVQMNSEEEVLQVIQQLEI